MIGIILAAGVGSRLRPMTNEKPKCLVTSANKPILQYQFDSYIAAGIRDVYVVVGYEGDAIREYCKHIKNLNVTIVENPIYEDSNNMYSLYLTREFAAGRAFILNNADLTMPADLVPSLVNDSRQDLIAVDVGEFNEESMKVAVNDSGSITNISKQIAATEAYGCSIDFYKFSEGSSSTFFGEMEKIIEKENNLKDWTEVAMQRLFKSGALSFEALDIHGMPWVEIDDYRDLALSDKIFGQIDRTVLDYQQYVLDMDGTIFVGDVPVPGAAAAIAKLKESGKRVVYLSNNSSRSKADYVRKLSRFGIDADEDAISLSTDAALSYLEAQKVNRIFVLGTRSLEQLAATRGFEITDDDPEFVLVGYDTELHYGKLETACRLLNKKIDYVATHCDLVCPTPDGPVPDAGLLTLLLERTTGRPPYKVFGKPNVETLEDICTVGGVGPVDTLVVGDRLYTDIKMANQASIDSVLVLSGDTAREEIEESDISPTYVLDSLADVFWQSD